MKAMSFESWGDGKRVVVSRADSPLVINVRQALNESPVAIDILEINLSNEGEVKFLYRHSTSASPEEARSLDEGLQAMIPE